MFIDEDLSEIRVCFDPRIISPSDLCIGSIKKAGLRELLNSQCMEGILQPDEIDGLLYAAEQNDEDLFRKESQKIMVPLSEPEKTSELLELPEFKMIILASILSLIFTLIKIPAAALIFVATEVFFAVKIFNLLVVWVIFDKTTSRHQDWFEIIFFTIGFYGWEDLSGFTRARDSRDADKLTIFGGSQNKIC